MYLTGRYIENISQIMTLTMLITLFFYHLIIFYGRRKYFDEFHHLHFAFFIIGLSGYLFINSYIYKDMFPAYITKYNPIAEVICTIIIYSSFTGFALMVIKLPVIPFKII